MEYIGVHALYCTYSSAFALPVLSFMLLTDFYISILLQEFCLMRVVSVLSCLVLFMFVLIYYDFIESRYNYFSRLIPIPFTIKCFIFVVFQVLFYLLLYLCIYFLFSDLLSYPFSGILPRKFMGLRA